MYKIQKNRWKKCSIHTKITEKEYQKRSSKNFLQKIYHGSVKELLLSFIEEKEMTEKDIEELMKEIKK